MKTSDYWPARWQFLVLLAILIYRAPGQAQTIFETTSPYHHILVNDQQGLRTLSFDGSMETRMSLRDPLTGHFEYTEYFHLPWLWNPEMKQVLMIGLGGASTQRSFQHYYTNLLVDTAELDAAVVEVAKKYFHLVDSPTHKIEVSDGRVFLRRSQKRYDAIILDAYVSGRYGSHLPYHLVTQEFFQMADAHLTTNGVLAYNVMGTFHGWQADILGAVYRTMKSVFPQVYLFPAQDSLNVVLIGTKSSEKLTQVALQLRVDELAKFQPSRLPNLRARSQAFRSDPPPTALQSPILTDDFAPVDGLLKTVPKAPPQAPQPATNRTVPPRP